MEVPIDHETLVFERPARTAMQRWWGVAPPAVIGVVIALVMVMSSLTPQYEPVQAYSAVCATDGDLLKVAACDGMVKRAQSRLETMRRAAVRAGDPQLDTLPERGSSDALARAQLMVRKTARARIGRWERQHAAWEQAQAVATQQRTWALLPVGAGGLLSALLILVVRRLRPIRRSITLSAHALTIDGRRIPFSEIERLELGPEQDGFQMLAVEPVTGSAVTLRLPVMTGEGERLGALLDRVVPAAAEREAERERLTRARQEAKGIVGRNV